MSHEEKGCSLGKADDMSLAASAASHFSGDRPRDGQGAFADIVVRELEYSEREGSYE